MENALAVPQLFPLSAIDFWELKKFTDEGTVKFWVSGILDTLCEIPEIYQGRIGLQFFDMRC